MIQKIHDDNEVDYVLMLTGVLSDPRPESNPIDVLNEALRIIKNKGKFIVGTVSSMPMSEKQKSEKFIRNIQDSSTWRDKVNIKNLSFELPSPVLYVIFGLYEINFTSVNGISSSPVINYPGGIDFHPDYLDIQTQGNGLNVSSPLNMDAMENIEINGLVPFIFSITPVTNIYQLMGVKEEEPFDEDEVEPFEQAKGREDDLQLSLLKY